MQDIISTLKNALQQAEAGLEVAVGRLAKDGTERGDFKPSEVLALACVREALAMPVSCLHQIQEPAAAEQAAWHAGLDEGRAQAAPAAVAVADELAAFEDATWYWVEKEGWIGDPPTIAPALYKAEIDAWYSFAFSGIPTRQLKVLEPCLMKARAALAATPAAASPAGWKLVPIEPTAEMLESAGTTDRDGTPATYKTLYMAMVGASPAAAPVVLPEPVEQVKEVMVLVGKYGSAVEANSTGNPSNYTLASDESAAYASIESKLRALLAQAATAAVPQAQADTRDDSALLDAMERQRIAVVPEYEGPWDAEVYNDEGEPIHAGSGSTPREAIRAAIAAAKGGV